MKILVIYTGGTIGCVDTPLRPMSGTEFRTAFDQLITPIVQANPDYTDCAFDFYAFDPALDSTNIQPSDWCEVAEQILTQYGNYGAFIVLHGTDSMAWTASALSFLLAGLDDQQRPLARLTKPVIVTGSQLPLFLKKDDTTYQILFDTDALQNVCGAVATAYAGIAEVGLYFNNKLMRGNRAVKTNASQFYAFSSPNYPILAEYGVEFTQATPYMLPPPAAAMQALDNQLSAVGSFLAEVKAAIATTGVIAFPAFPAWTNTTSGTALIGSVLGAALQQGVKGLVLESYGEGNFPSGNPDHPEAGAIYQVLKTAHEAGVVIVDTTEVNAGIVNGAAYAAGSWLSDVGAIGAYDMTPCAALAKLTILSATPGLSQGQIEVLMQTSLAGEIMDVNRVDSRTRRFLAPGESITTFDGKFILVNDALGGPVLKSIETGDVLLQLLKPVPSAMPGRLSIDTTGTLTFDDRLGAPTEVKAPTTPAQAAMLVLSGGGQAGAIQLAIVDAATNAVVAQLYPEN